MNNGTSLAIVDISVMISNGYSYLASGGSVLLLQSQLDVVLALLDIAKLTMKQVSTNFAWVIVYNDVAVALDIRLGTPLDLHISLQ